MGKRVVEEKIQLNQNTSGMTQTDSTADVLSKMVEYTVPDRSEIILEPTDFISLYLEDTGAAELTASDRVVISYTDPQGRREQYIADAEYTVFKEFQDSLKKFFVGKRVVIPANFVLKISVNASGTGTDTSDCRWAISATLVYETID